jgi:UDP-N-acetylglucosamine:LPS N-acetylglucosamine transferase
MFVTPQSRGPRTIAAVTAPSQPDILLFILDAGGGHRAAANAIVAAAAQQGRPWRLGVVNLQDVLAPLDFGRALTGRPMEQTYNDMVRRGRTRLLVPLLRSFQWLIRRMREPLCRLIAAELGQQRPSLVVSLAPNFNGVVRLAVKRSLEGTPFFVVLTDFADFPPHFWMEPGLDGVVVGSDHAFAQALEAGLPAERVMRTSGMILHPRFYPPPDAVVRARVRAELGIGDDDFTVLLLFGGKGSPELRPLIEALRREAPRLHLIAVCGDNPPLFQSLKELERSADGKLHRLGFTDRVAEYLAASDLLVTKPGPASLAEAFHVRVPVIVTCNDHTIPQERYNARLVRERNLGVVVRRWQEIPAAVAELHRDPPRLQSYRAHLSALPRNQAVFEVLDLFARALGG